MSSRKEAVIKTELSDEDTEAGKKRSAVLRERSGKEPEKDQKGTCEVWNGVDGCMSAVANSCGTSAHAKTRAHA